MSEQERETWQTDAALVRTYRPGRQGRLVCSCIDAADPMRGVRLAKQIVDDHNRIPELEGVLGQMGTTLKLARCKHLVVEGDCWFSCPESGECCDDTKYGCTCGADYMNTIIDKAIEQARAALPVKAEAG